MGAPELALDQCLFGGERLAPGARLGQLGANRGLAGARTLGVLAQLVGAAALLGELLAQGGGLGGLLAETILEARDLFLVSADLVVEDLALRAHGRELDALAFRRHRAVMELGGDL